MVHHVLARQIPTNITHLRFTARDAQGNVFYATPALAKQTDITLSPVPVQATELLIEYLAGSNLLGIFVAPLSLQPGQTFVVDDPAFLDVTAAITALDLTPLTPQIAKGTSQQFMAVATLSDASMVNLNGQVSWNSSDPTVADISNLGRATGLMAGTSDITAAIGSFSATTTLTVTNAALTKVVVSPPTATVAAGTAQQYTALGLFSDGTTQDLTATAAWNATGMATINATGLATGSTAGGAQVTATFNGMTSDPAVLTVSNATILALQVSPNNIQLNPGAMQAFTVLASLSDGNTQNMTGSAAWTSTGTIAANLFTADATGDFTVTATVGSLSQTVPVKVTQPTGSGPLLFTGHNASMFRLLAFSIDPQTGVLAPFTNGYPQDSTAFTDAGTQFQFVKNPAGRYALLLNRRTSANNTVGSWFTVAGDGTSVNNLIFTIIGAVTGPARFSSDGRLLAVAAQTSVIAMTARDING
ncbi:MAG: Ig-like domain-containing protein, partial [Candidatus Eremiobacteraeota bacterium]|nr:Ig-like domain-containing protein [Candidatus Eremiobacteraeota bacterium]